MYKKIIGIFVIMLLLSVMIPVSAETNTVEVKDSGDSPINFFRGGYIETVKTGEFEPSNTNSVFGLGLFCHYGENTETTVYSEEGGDILLNIQGKHSMIYVFFTGYSEKTEDTYKMYGNARFIISISF